jgi:hypothetical protein
MMTIRELMDLLFGKVVLVRVVLCSFVLLGWTSATLAQNEGQIIDLKIEQVTSGERHHFFGYIGQCQTIPWNASGRYILGLEIDRIDQMPKPDEAATIILIDTHNENRIVKVDRTHAWNPQQGTMFFWNPLKAESQFFFNDKDIETGEVFTVVYDVEEKRRVQEFRFPDTPIGNGGVAADGSAWLGINYGRLARLRPVTGYSGALDWSIADLAPKNDGIFVVDLRSGEKRLLVSYHLLDQHLRETNPDLSHSGLFINHTLWNRPADLVYFFVRAGWSGHSGERINVPFSIRSDGTGLTMHNKHIGGHPEWAVSREIIIGIEKGTGETKDKQVLYNVETQEIVGELGSPEIFPKPEGDISLSPDGNWFVNGYSRAGKNYYAVYRMADGAYAVSEGVSKGAYSGDIRIDPAPRWNRDSDQILIPGIATNGTRQIFLINVYAK